jgi:dipeptidyl aminopeptidase/acylaminoacyl peptidase
MQQEGDTIFLRGPGSSRDGERPFLDKFDLATGDPSGFSAAARIRTNQVLTLRERRHALVRDLVPVGERSAQRLPAHAGRSHRGARGEAVYAPGNRTPITRMTDPTPQVRQIKKQLVRYKRADGLDLSFTLYTPPGYREGRASRRSSTPIRSTSPKRRWRAQVSGSQHTFTRLRQYRLLLLAGYAIIDNLVFPIIGDPKKAYDTYLEQLVADARAAVDEAVRMGVADPDRIGVTGHSHGALMTVNLVAHSDMFRAGVATSGSYNKTLTPFGFQSERARCGNPRTCTSRCRPFFVADKVKTPLLIVHGPMTPTRARRPCRRASSTRRFEATAASRRLVILPERAPLVHSEGIQRATHLRDAAVVRQVREERAGALSLTSYRSGCFPWCRCWRPRS